MLNACGVNQYAMLHYYIDTLVIYTYCYMGIGVFNTFKQLHLVPGDIYSN